MRAINLESLDTLIRPAVEGQGYELVELHWGRQPGGNVLRVTIDRLPGQGRVSHDDCTRVSREVSALLDVHDLLPGHYSLEVSSPGLDRPLKRVSDFERFLGQRAKVRMKPEVPRSNLGLGLGLGSPPESTSAPPRRTFTGTIQGVSGDLVRLDAEGVGPVDLHIAEMEKANLIYSF